MLFWLSRLSYQSPISLMGVAVQIHAVLEYMDIDSLKFASAPGPFGDRGGMPLMAPWG